jgi:hypothetical protein
MSHLNSDTLCNTIAVQLACDGCGGAGFDHIGGNVLQLFFLAA